MKYSGPFEVKRLVEFQQSDWDPSVLLRHVSASQFAATRSSQDARFVNVEAGKLVMSFHSYVVSNGSINLLVDSCVGNHKRRPSMPDWHMQQRPYLEQLAKVGLSVDEIDFVCCTHLHADHIGWNTRLQGNRWVPTFPNARYLFARTEMEYWGGFHGANPVNAFQNSWADSVLPVLEAGQVDMVDSDYEIARGIYLESAPGHTPGNVVVNLEHQGCRAVMCGDVLHHAVQIEKPGWSSNFCLDPIESAVTRRRLLDRVADSGTTLLPAHFGGPTAVRVVGDGNGYYYETPD